MDTDKTNPSSLFSIRVWSRLSAARQISAFFCNLVDVILVVQMKNVAGSRQSRSL
jgi:hypothetical protein